MKEEWRKFRDSNYSVSNKGNVRNDVTGHPIKPKNTQGYNSFVVHDHGKRTYIFTHRAVGELFIPNPENKSQINNVDGNKRNNNVSNLEWVTQEENLEHAYRTGLIRKNPEPKRPTMDHRLRPIICTTINERFNGIVKAADYYGLTVNGIGKVLSGERNHVHGLHFEYL